MDEEKAVEVEAELGDSRGVEASVEVHPSGSGLAPYDLECQSGSAGARGTVNLENAGSREAPKQIIDERHS